MTSSQLRFSSLALALTLGACSAVVSPDPTRLGGGHDAGAGALDARLDPTLDAACPGSLVACGGRCVDTTRDPSACGGCGRACGAGRECVASACVCPPSDPACAPVTGLGDPSRCGPSAVRCRDDQLCVSGACTCRPPLVAVGDRCLDLLTDPDNCGMPGMRCGGVCAMGRCLDGCPDGTRSCDDACVDLRTDPTNCGECGRACRANEACQGGECRDVSLAIGCTSCPCEACRGSACCVLPRLELPYCLDADRCP